ncbi:unnamed protein product [Haemonchus placei]|uniref:G_PROTEIN_RECEP_F1_2 domain-containing protein n=1 Tax=Haemonchus placei TaxID=6290 RepID=A0A0N4WWF0_HAEPC|nr:unnamed protein product [Haemonchus placei]
MAQTRGITYPSRKSQGETPEWEQENDETSKPSSSLARSDGVPKQYSSENSENEKLNRKSKTALTAINSILEEMPKAKKAKKAKKEKKVPEAPPPPVEVLIRTECPHGPLCRHDDPVEEFKMVCQEQKSAVVAAMRAEAEKQVRMSRRGNAKANQEPKVIEFTAYCRRSAPVEGMKANEEDQASELPTPHASQVLLRPYQELQLPPDIPPFPVKQANAYQEYEVTQTPLNTPHMAARKTKVAKASQMFQMPPESAQAAEITAKVDQASCGLQTTSNSRSIGRKTKNDQASTLPPTSSSTPSCIKKRMKVATSTDSPRSAELAAEADQGTDALPNSPDSPQTAEIKMKTQVLTEAYQKLEKSLRAAGADLGDDQKFDSHETPPHFPCSDGEKITVDQVSELLEASPDSPQTAEMKAKIEQLTRAYQELGISDEESEAGTLPPPPNAYENSQCSVNGGGDHSAKAPKDLSSSEENHEIPEDLQGLFDDPEVLESIKKFLFYANLSDNDDSASRRRLKPDIYDVKTETDEHIFAMSTNSRLTYIETYQCRAVLVCLREFEMLIKSRSDDHQRIRNVTLKSAKALKNLINTVYNICQSENLLMELFIFRWQAMLMKDHVLRLNKKLIYAICFAFFFLFNGAVIAAGSTMPNRIEELKPVYIQNYSCIAEMVNFRGVQYFNLGDYRRLFFVTTVGATVVVTTALFLVYLTSRSLQTKNVSQKTVDMQRRYQISLILQVVIPIFVVIAPGCAVMMFGAWSDINVSISYISQIQVATNVVLSLISCHGLFGTVIMVLVNQPYRRFASDCVRACMSICMRTKLTEMELRRRRSSQVRDARLSSLAANN